MPEPEVAPAWRADGRATLVLVGLRCLQFGIDLALTALLTLVPLAATLLVPRNPDGTFGNPFVAIPMVLGILLGAVLVSWWYWALRPSGHQGATPAMQWLGLRVVSLDGSPASPTQLTIRWLLLLLDAAFAGLVGLAAMLLTPDAQRLGDLAAGTLVVRSR